MSDDFEEVNIEALARQTCRLIRQETIAPLSWFFPVSNPCVSCTLITGGNPEIMAAYCSRVINRLKEESEPEEPEKKS